MQPVVPFKFATYTELIGREHQGREASFRRPKQPLVKNMPGRLPCIPACLVVSAYARAA